MVLLLASAIIVVVAVLGAIRYLPAVDAARSARATAAALLTDVRALSPGDLDRETVASLASRLEQLASQRLIMEDLLASDPLVGLARGFGPTRGTIVGADATIAATGALIDAGRLAVVLGQRVAELREGAGSGASTSMLSSLVALMQGSTDEVDLIAARIADAQERLAAVPADAASPVLELRDLLMEPLGRYGGVLDAYRRADDVLPGILGSGAARRYLVMAQNPAELRPTGGFNGTIGILEVHDGAITQMTFRDVYALDLQTGMPYHEPPPALRAHLLNRSSWELADANWSPDFPTSAQDALRLYAIESGDEDIDGVIAITTFALDALMELTGPIEVPEYGVTVQPGDVTVVSIANTRELEAGTDRKRFLDLLATSALARLMATPPEDWGRLLEVLERIGRQRLILAWVTDPAAQSLIAQGPWGGTIRSTPGDYLALVDANVTPSSKLSLVVERGTTLEVALDGDGTASSHLRIDWRNDGGLAGEVYDTLRAASLDPGGIYGVFNRVLVPKGTEVVDAYGESLLPVSGVEFLEEEAGRVSIGNYLVIEPGTAWLEYAWTTPGIVLEEGDDRVYQLTIQKQPGMGPEPVRIVVRLPDGASVLGATPGVVVEGEQATFETSLTEDVTISVRYRP